MGSGPGGTPEVRIPSTLPLQSYETLGALLTNSEPWFLLCPLGLGR